MAWFWYFLIYSFFGFLLEVAFARVTRSAKPDRKCFLFLPLCPVYGLGALAILAVSHLPGSGSLLGMAAMGGAAATVVEYLMDLFYEKALGVSFWDYSDLPLNVDGRVCLPFSLAWGVLAVGLIRMVHPRMEALVDAVPAGLFPAAVILFVCDALMSAFLLKATGTTDSLKWYD